MTEELKDGKKYLVYVLERLKQRISRISLSIAEGQKEIEGMHEYYWENYTEMDQYGYENFDNQQALLHQINANEQQLHLKRRFQKMQDSPFFGRVDFRFEGEEEPEIFYIGIGNFSQEAGGVPLVYDWRAPVSGLFYDYDRGEASYQAPVGTITGEICSKWQYKIRRGRMVYQFESDVKIDDEILMAELGTNGEAVLKNIIRTIQKEQNAIIRNTKARIMVIQGAAGSGKTSIALHRIAYLLYHDRKNLKSSNILILSPNGIFSDYISHILPELGEERIREMSFDLFAYRQLQDAAADCEDRCDQIERILSGDRASEERCKEKQSQDFLNRLEGYLVRLEDSLMEFGDVTYKGFTQEESQIIQLFYFKFPDIPLLSRMEALWEYFVDQVETLRGGELPPEEREMLLERFEDMYETKDLYVLYSRFLQENGYEELPHKPLSQRKLRYEDVYPILYMKYRLQRQGSHGEIKHLIVDEMQDYTPLQYRILQLMFSCRMTILGDKAQTVFGEQQDAAAFLPKIFGRDVRTVVMNKSYRSTVEIASYANRLAGITDMELFLRHGAPVEEKCFSHKKEAFQEIVQKLELGEEAFETAAVILRTEAEAKEAAELLEELLRRKGFDTEKSVSYLHRDSTAFQKGLTVTTFYLAKGLEFDQVFTLFPAWDQSAAARQGRYIGATRALHRLHMYQVGS
ncbi:MAG: AAA family ATPase [Eubacteriales bacterium]|nr:AAA family ATPase [Eubacteriales bacterium]